jgi:uncharacterized protein (DUF4415 family)
MNEIATETNNATESIEASETRKKTRKLRVTTFLDRDVVMWLRVRALDQRMGYQTLLNRFLRTAIDRETKAGQSGEPVSRAEYTALLNRIELLEQKLQANQEEVIPWPKSAPEPRKRIKLIGKKAAKWMKSKPSKSKLNKPKFQKAKPSRHTKRRTHT